jgi:hypothetical protein
MVNLMRRVGSGKETLRIEEGLYTVGGNKFESSLKYQFG